MPDHLTWEEVLKRDDIVGGDIEFHEFGSIYRGPISSIKIVAGQLFVELLWAARLSNSLGEGWKVWHITNFAFPTNIIPTPINSGCVSFWISRLSFGIIFPKGGSKLDPKDVKGLNR